MPHHSFIGRNGYPVYKGTSGVTHINNDIFNSKNYKENMKYRTDFLKSKFDFRYNTGYSRFI